MTFKLFSTVRGPNKTHSFVTYKKQKHPINRPGRKWGDDSCGRFCPCGRRTRIKLCFKKKNTVYTLLLQWQKIKKEILINLNLTNGILFKANIDLHVTILLKSFMYCDTTLKYIKV
jgi:hypothetical protein